MRRSTPILVKRQSEQWFRAEPDGSGTGLDDSAGIAAGNFRLRRPAGSRMGSLEDGFDLLCNKPSPCRPADDPPQLRSPAKTSAAHPRRVCRTPCTRCRTVRRVQASGRLSSQTSGCSDSRRIRSARQISTSRMPVRVISPTVSGHHGTATTMPMGESCIALKAAPELGIARLRSSECDLPAPIRHQSEASEAEYHHRPCGGFGHASDDAGLQLHDGSLLRIVQRPQRIITSESGRRLVDDGPANPAVQPRRKRGQSLLSPPGVPTLSRKDHEERSGEDGQQPGNRYLINQCIAADLALDFGLEHYLPPASDRRRGGGRGRRGP